MVGQESAAEASLAQEICKLRFGAGRNMGSKDFPAFLTILESRFQNLLRARLLATRPCVGKTDTDLLLGQGIK